MPTMLIYAYTLSVLIFVYMLWTKMETTKFKKVFLTGVISASLYALNYFGLFYS
ncbi:hypothetical protein P4493_04540 [Bacillus thuringiensis]|uniref:Membrane protein n=1 Tax=Bacillus thuringiensis TaxID=1428 RepID=A0A0B5NP26_BACTU|nr:MULTISPECIES: hypothetical protein [Bacillus]MEC2535145.1 hypothetical protein [Bacillus cereus]MED1153740.1 hypothetical protein [Bacillus paranthracis]AJG73883.1 putative membrane protein [Bacillus thuringiensis]AJH02934.1 putative membrane protein [Bacillus thuringiensis HD1002]MCC4008974.1 hypothetical protein [Bacillus thuringiensis]